MTRGNRRLNIVLALGAFALVFLPWYRIEGGFFSFRWLSEFLSSPAMRPVCCKYWFMENPGLPVPACFSLPDALSARLAIRCCAASFLRGLVLPVSWF